MELPFLPDRDFFTMREAMNLTQVPAHTLRYWETRFGDLRPARLQGGHRRYTRADIELILAIKELLDKKKMTIAGARKALLERKRGKTAFDEPLPAETSDHSRSAKLLREIRKELTVILSEFSR